MAIPLVSRSIATHRIAPGNTGIPWINLQDLEQRTASFVVKLMVKK
ncbi:MAG: hypothetical protein QW775_00875 [Ignisphaera sp.]